MAIKPKEVDYTLPIADIKIGTLLDYSGQYVNGWESGSSKVVKIFREEMWEEDSFERSLPANSIFAKLENNKLILVAFDKHEKGIEILYKNIKIVE